MVLEILKQRRSVREFKPDPIPETALTKILTAAQMSPTANNNRGIEYICVSDPHTKAQIYEFATPQQDFVKQAPLIIVPIIDITKSNYPVQDLSLASQFIFLQATALNIGSVWKNLRPEPAKKIHDLLKIPENFQLINVIPVGYPINMPPPYTETIFEADRIHSDFF
jgi:nitroreductase